MYRLNSSNAGFRIKSSGITMSCGFAVSNGLFASLNIFSPASEYVNP